MDVKVSVNQFSNYVGNKQRAIILSPIFLRVLTDSIAILQHDDWREMPTYHFPFTFIESQIVLPLMYKISHAKC
jgi:hypothetical protein